MGHGHQGHLCRSGAGHRLKGGGWLDGGALGVSQRNVSAGHSPQGFLPGGTIRGEHGLESNTPHCEETKVSSASKGHHLECPLLPWAHLDEGAAIIMVSKSHTSRTPPLKESRTSRRTKNWAFSPLSQCGLSSSLNQGLGTRCLNNSS